MQEFDGQVRQTFANLEATISRAGGTLQDIVTMTVFIIDARYGDRFIEMRKSYFPSGYPASACNAPGRWARSGRSHVLHCP